MRTVAIALAAVGIVVAALGVSGCTAPRPPIYETVGEPLTRVTDEAQEEVTLLIQDASPRVGREATFRTDSQGGWVVVASCANSDFVGDATAIEVAVIPEATYTESVRADIAEGLFADSVTCDGLEHR